MKINRFYYITILTIFLFILFSLNIITQKVFVLVFIPLSLCMLIIGVLELKKTIKNRSSIEEEANKFKDLLEERMK